VGTPADQKSSTTLSKRWNANCAILCRSNAASREGRLLPIAAEDPVSLRKMSYAGAPLQTAGKGGTLGSHHYLLGRFVGHLLTGRRWRRTRRRID